jgi:large subunit ribosomal protein L37Ae
MGRTKKVKSAGKFGTRYGTKARKRYADLDTKMRRPHECPACKRYSVKRTSTGIWKCRKCSEEFVGGAYLPKTNVAMDSERVLKGLETGG